MITTIISYFIIACLFTIVGFLLGNGMARNKLFDSYEIWYEFPSGRRVKGFSMDYAIELLNESPAKELQLYKSDERGIFLKDVSYGDFSDEFTSE